MPSHCAMIHFTVIHRTMIHLAVIHLTMIHLAVIHLTMVHRTMVHLAVVRWFIRTVLLLVVHKLILLLPRLKNEPQLFSLFLHEG